MIHVFIYNTYSIDIFISINTYVCILRYINNIYITVYLYYHNQSKALSLIIVIINFTTIIIVSFIYNDKCEIFYVPGVQYHGIYHN